MDDPFNPSPAHWSQDELEWLEEHPITCYIHPDYDIYSLTVHNYPLQGREQEFTFSGPVLQAVKQVLGIVQPDILSLPSCEVLRFVVRRMLMI